MRTAVPSTTRGSTGPPCPKDPACPPHCYGFCEARLSLPQLRRSRPPRSPLLSPGFLITGASHVHTPPGGRTRPALPCLRRGGSETRWLHFLRRLALEAKLLSSVTSNAQGRLTCASPPRARSSDVGSAALPHHPSQDHHSSGQGEGKRGYRISHYTERAPAAPAGRS